MQEIDIKLILEQLQKVDPSIAYKQTFEYDGSDNVIYIGLAKSGTSKSDAKWQIRKLTYSGSNVTDIEFANGSTEFIFVWNSRSSYTYS